MSELRFDDRVAVITGAGGGLGRAHALLLAARGAKVVVNDLGGSFTGDGASQSAADRVVDEIRAAGGTAVASYDSVTDGKAIIDTAVREFGRVDIVVNNAGILRDVSFHKMTQDDWDKVYQVHVQGAFQITHAAWPILREQGYGRVVMTSSAAGIYGNFGQANYAKAKLGLVGFTNTLAIEGLRKNIHVNAIAPIAGSRMTETVLPKDLLDALQPELVSPLVAWLCHESCEETGGLFEVGGGFMGKLRWERAAGTCVRLGRAMTPELVKKRWSDVAGFEHATHPEHIAASMQPILDNVSAGPSKGGNEFIDVDLALGTELPPMTSSYGVHDVALYALSIGAARDPMDPSQLQYVYEMASGGMKTLPPFGVIPALGAVMELYKKGQNAPGLNYGFDRILHGEQVLELRRPLPTSAELTHKAKVTRIYDKGKHAVVTTEIRSFDAEGNELTVNELTTFVRGAGGWGGDRGPSEPVNVPPERAPDAVVEEQVLANQALLYRLTGDINPLHADPGFARSFGFDRPILHGLCTFGFAARHVIQTFAKDGNPDLFKRIEVRFAGTVFPGETLITEMWKESGTRIVFRVKVKERDAVVVSNAAVELFTEVPKPAAKPRAQAKASDVAAADAAPEPTTWDVFVAIRDHVQRHPELVGKIGFVFQFRIESPDSVWTLDLRNGSGAVSEGEPVPPDCTLTIAEADFLAMTSGQVDPMKLFTTGKLKISGNIMASQKLEFLQKIDQNEAREAVARARAAGEGPGQPNAAAAASTSAREPEAHAIFAAVNERLAQHPALAQEVGATQAFFIQVTDPESGWIVDLTGPRPAVKEASGGASTTLTLSDADLAALARGDAEARDLYQRGKLRVDGDVAVARHLSFLRG